MQSFDVVLSPIGIEDPKIHVVSVNDFHVNVAIELRVLTLIGEPSHGERRFLSVDTLKMKNVFEHKSDSATANKVFQSIMKRIGQHTVNGEIKVGQNITKNVAYDGLAYAAVYYLLAKQFGVTISNRAITNTFDTILPSLDGVNHLISYITEFDNIQSRVGSELHCLSKSQILHSNDMSNRFWKVLYINKILISLQRNQYYDWAFMRCVSKRTFSDAAIIESVTDGCNIKYIQETACRQAQLSTSRIKQLAQELREAALGVDFALGDLAIIVFFKAGLKSLSQSQHMLSQPKNLKSIINQYLSATSTLLQLGIIHNDPSLENIILDNGNLLLINYEKSILSKDHTDNFAIEEIRATVSTIFPDKTVSQNFDQALNCYAAYDIIRFLLVLKTAVFQSPRHQHAVIDKVLAASVSIFRNIDQDNGVDSNWIDQLVQRSGERKPTFVSSRRRRSERLKSEYLSKYIQSVMHA